MYGRKTKSNENVGVINLKAKIKLELVDNFGCQRTRSLIMILIVNDRFLNKWYRSVIIDGDKFEYISNRDRFYNDVYNFITDRETIIKRGEESLKDIIKDKLKENKIEEIERLLKEFKPIEIEVEK